MSDPTIVEFLRVQYDAEVDAKRRIIELHHAVTDGTGETSCGACWKPRQLYPAAWPCETLRLLALPYASHPSYDEGWRS